VTSAIVLQELSCFRKATERRQLHGHMLAKSALRTRATVPAKTCLCLVVTPCSRR